MTPDQSPAPSKPHGLVIGLIFAVLLLTLVAVAFMVTTQGKITTSDEYIAACKTQVAGAVLDATREIARVCTDGSKVAPITESVPASGNTMGFDYPADWSVAIYPTPAEAITWRASLVPEYFYFCEGCDGPFIDISLQVGNMADPAIAAQPSFRDYLNTIYTAENGFSDVTITTTSAFRTHHEVTGKLDGLYQGTFEAVYRSDIGLYKDGTLQDGQWTSAFYLDRDPIENATNDAWLIVKGSLDTSGFPLPSYE